MDNSYDRDSKILKNFSKVELCLQILALKVGLQMNQAGFLRKSMNYTSRHSYNFQACFLKREIAG